MQVHAENERSAPSVTVVLLPFTLAMFLGFLAVGVPIAVLPTYVSGVLGFSPVVVGIIAGLQSAATLLTRRSAGRLIDTRGPKFASAVGFACASTAGLCYFVSWGLEAVPLVSLAILAIGRIFLGFGESLFITAVSTWSISHVGTQHTGRAMAWSGVAMYGALALGAPLGVSIDAAGGFVAVAICAIVTPMLGAAIALQWTYIRSEGGSKNASFFGALRLIWMPGLAMALASSGTGTISAFLALLYRQSGWAGPGFALTAFGCAYLTMRFLFSGLPDRAGGYRTAMISLIVEGIGLMTVWQAHGSLVAFIGAGLTGLGYSLVFPSLGVEALRRVGGENRGMVLGAYLACFDLGIALSGPAAGAVTQAFGLPAAFAAAGVASFVGVILAGLSWTKSRAKLAA